MLKWEKTKERNYKVWIAVSDNPCNNVAGLNYSKDDEFCFKIVECGKNEYIVVNFNDTDYNAQYMFDSLDESKAFCQMIDNYFIDLNRLD